MRKMTSPLLCSNRGLVVGKGPASKATHPQHKCHHHFPKYVYLSYMPCTRFINSIFQHPKTEGKRRATPVNAIASSSKPKQLVTEGGTSGERKGKARETRSDPRHPLRQSNRATKNQRNMAESDSGDEELNVKEEDTATELGEISEDDATSTLSSRKRKRALSVAVQRKALKRESNQTPAGAKRASRSQSLASVKASRIFPSYRCRVLALSASDGHWFIGTVTQEHKGDTYRVEFDDGSAENARSGSMRTLELRIGDEVQDNRGTKKMGKIVEVKNDMVVVSCVKGPNFDLPFPSLRIPPDIVETQWEDRPVTRKILAGVTNSSDRWATHSTLSENADDFLKGCAVIITSNQEKDEIVASMIANGTTLIEDWSDALQIGGTYSYDKGKGKARKGKGKSKSSQMPTSWKITKKEVQWFEASEERTVERVFVIADDVCQKPKYLVALALGVPCLSTTWIKDNLNDPDGKDWSRYLLPKGSFPSVDGEDILMSQSVNLRWGTDPDHLVNIMDNSAAVKLFAGMSILCVGDGYIPEQNEDRMDAVNKFENLNTISNRSKITSGVALIILAMGACQVIACNEWQHAPQDEEFDLAVFKDPKCMAKAGKPAGKSLHVSWAWVKQSLIRGVSVKPMF
ncbi:hypothetical protein BDP27DRAFT_37632 [Rhodocollybia butyracea]|uniref:BRCT domain-containing protein n=1 Tax=Rhodocollybia butyracea TaxID=206335 RepID=A0A9P5Q5Z4_9AGAR|nr:hypothetical protein BDP27DRAFT_37632 [Rhodocollybia butyracea]